jgi:hypothetical protein
VKWQENVKELSGRRLQSRREKATSSGPRRSNAHRTAPGNTVMLGQKPDMNKPSANTQESTTRKRRRDERQGARRGGDAADNWKRDDH